MKEKIAQLTNADIYQMAGLPVVETLTLEAQKLYEQKAKDRLSFKEHFFEKYLKLVVERWNSLRGDAGIDAPLSLTLKHLSVLVDYDITAPKKETPCVYCLSAAVFQKAAERGLKIDLEKLKKAAPDKLAGVLKKLQPIKEAVLKENQDIYFYPRRWKKVLLNDTDSGQAGDFVKDKETGEFKEYGNFILCEFDDHTLGDQLELALTLGIRFGTKPVWKILAACGQANNWDENGKWANTPSHLYCLQTFAGKKIIRKKAGAVLYGRFGRPKLGDLCLIAETFRSAILRLKRIHTPKKPKEIVESKIRDHSCFAFAFDRFTPELDKEVENCSSEKEVNTVIREFFKKFTSEEIGNMQILLGQNVGDQAEGKRIGRSGNRGKPPGLGPFGGKPEPDDKNLGYDLEKLLPKFLFQITEEDVFFKRLVSGMIREVQNESGFKVEKIYGRIASIKKGDDHLYHIWLVRVNLGHTTRVKEIREMSQGQARFWFSLNETFRMTIGGLDAPPRKDRIYCSALINLGKFIKKFGLAIPEGMTEFEKKLERSRKGLA